MLPVNDDDDDDDNNTNNNSNLFSQSTIYNLFWLKKHFALIKKFISIKNISIIKSKILISSANVVELQYIFFKFNNNEHILLVTILTIKISYLQLIHLKTTIPSKTLFTIPFV